jgi:hypothetical protein
MAFPLMASPLITSPVTNTAALPQDPSLLSLFSRALVWRGDASYAEREVERTCFTALDAALPGGGWPRGALTELLHEQDGLGELSLLMPLLARQSVQQRIAFVSPPHIPYAPALVQAGIRLERLVIVQPSKAEDAWWTAEAMLRAGQFASVLFWPDKFDERRLRRLQSACEEGAGCGFVFHPLSAAPHASPAPLRLRVGSCINGGQSQTSQSHPGCDADVAAQVAAGNDSDYVHLTILKRRGSLVANPLVIKLRGNAPTIPAAVSTTPISSTPTTAPTATPTPPSRPYAIRNSRDMRQARQEREARSASALPVTASAAATAASATWSRMNASADTLKLSTPPAR